MIKGQEGEAFVIREVGKVANYLGKTIRCFNHVILDFDSVYGSRTAELDHIIICGDKILIGETKNANYVSTEYSEIPWNLMNGKTTDNPIVQNHYHKQIFCSLFNISRENVITVECLLEYENVDTGLSFQMTMCWGTIICLMLFAYYWRIVKRQICMMNSVRNLK